MYSKLACEFVCIQAIGLWICLCTVNWPVNLFVYRRLVCGFVPPLGSDSSSLYLALFLAGIIFHHGYQCKVPPRSCENTKLATWICLYCGSNSFEGCALLVLTAAGRSVPNSPYLGNSSLFSNKLIFYTLQLVGLNIFLEPRTSDYFMCLRLH